ncbi:MAG: DUF2232 domain-containing protein [Holosporaceae bacterium]|jgi:hypothetical protein|nr:DUF2232 domain-containing protein [Holosporaceae bacterium]
MLPSKSSNHNILIAVFLGICSLFVTLESRFIQIKFLLSFLNVPLLFSYLSYGPKCGFISSVVVGIPIFFFFSLNNFLDICLNMIAPAIMLGCFSTKYIVKERKIWWYPETLLLQNFALFSFIILVLCSFTFRSEDMVLKILQEARRPIIKFMRDVDEFQTRQIWCAINAFVKYAAGIEVLCNMFSTLSNFYIAYLIGKKTQTNIRTEYNFLELRIPSWLAIFPLVALTATYFFPDFSFVFCGLFVVGLFAPIVSGISLVHYIAKTKNSRYILVIFYVGAFIFPILFFPCVVTLAIIDSFHSLRKSIR